FWRLTEQSKINDFTKYSPVSEETAKAFGEGNGPSPHGNDTYCLYLGEGWQQVAWKHTVIATMASAMLMEAVESQLEPALGKDVVKVAIWDFVKQAWNSWSSTKLRVHKSGEWMENASKAFLRNTHYQSQRSQAVKNNNRKAQKYNNCEKGIMDLLKDPLQTTIAKRKWAMMAEINHALHHEGQSSEESDYDCDHLLHQAAPLKVKKPHYHCCIVGELLEDVDIAIDKLHENTAHASGK
ncbi:hypothetical protein BT96DRAFT_786254, partial [Gymnopus androsaceus JB14]